METKRRGAGHQIDWLLHELDHRHVGPAGRKRHDPAAVLGRPSACR
jgi:hypothetical protein